MRLAAAVAAVLVALTACSDDRADPAPADLGPVSIESTTSTIPGPDLSTTTTTPGTSSTSTTPTTVAPPADPTDPAYPTSVPRPPVTYPSTDPA